MAETIIQSDSFTSNGRRKVIKIRSGIDKFEVWNLTNADAQTDDEGIYFLWKRGFPTAIANQRTGGIRQMNADGDGHLVQDVMVFPNGFKLIDNNVEVSFTPVLTVAGLAFTGMTDAASPVVSAANAGTEIQVGDVVRFSQTAPVYGVIGTSAANMLGMDWQVGAINAGVSFTLSAVLANAPGVTAPTGTYRRVNDLPLYRNYWLANVTQAVQPTVSFTTDHYFEVGDQFRFHVNYAPYGMLELDGLVATVVSVPSTSTVTIDIDTTGFTAFAFPTATQVIASIVAKESYNWASVVPLIDNNTIAMVLLTGNAAAAADFAQNPAGTSGDVMFWEAGKSWNQ